MKIIILCNWFKLAVDQVIMQSMLTEIHDAILQETGVDFNITFVNFGFAKLPGRDKVERCIEFYHESDNSHNVVSAVDLFLRLTTQKLTATTYYVVEHTTDTTWKNPTHWHFSTDESRSDNVDLLAYFYDIEHRLIWADAQFTRETSKNISFWCNVSLTSSKFQGYIPYDDYDHTLEIDMFRVYIERDMHLHTSDFTVDTVNYVSYTIVL